MRHSLLHHRTMFQFLSFLNSIVKMVKMFCMGGGELTSSLTWTRRYTHDVYPHCIYQNLNLLLSSTSVLLSDEVIKLHLLEPGTQHGTINRFGMGATIGSMDLFFDIGWRLFD